jgi:type II secretory pathway pseudopilin PulG
MNSPAAKNNEAGFSLIEMLIAIGAMVVITASILTLMKDGLRVSNGTYELADAQESLRTAQEYISRDLVVAGDGLRGINNVVVPVAFATNYLAVAPVTDPTTPGYVNLAILTSDDSVPAGTLVRNTAPAVNVRSNPVQTDRLTILEADRTFTPITLPSTAIPATGATITIAAGDASKFNVGEIYFITSEIGGAFGTITAIGGAGATRLLSFANGDLCGLNVVGSAGPLAQVSRGLPTSLMRMQIVHYFVDTNGLLIRRVFGVRGTALTDSVVAEHVTDLQFRYALNLPDDNGFVKQPVRRLSTSEEQVSVRQVEVTLSTETVHFVNQQNINGKPSGTRQGMTMTTSTSVRNLQFREALQPTEDDPALQ